MDELECYRRHSALTDPGAHRARLGDLPADVEALGAIVRGVVVHREETSWLHGLDLPAHRWDEANTRWTQAILGYLGDLRERPAAQRFAGTCRDFSILLCALLREVGVPARLRAGFAGYFTTGFFDDHWVVEHWSAGHGWRLADGQLAGGAAKAYQADVDPLDVPRDAFLVGGQAWLECRAGRWDPDRFGVSVAGLTGMWEVQGNVVRDLAALAKVETLPWDDWGIIGRHFDDLSSDDRDLFDRAAAVSAAGGPLDAARAALDADDRLRPPAIPRAPDEKKEFHASGS
ncbi:MAG: transglutaminase-like domain-containing protein [Natronosporangium sp.]